MPRTNKSSDQRRALDDLNDPAATQQNSRVKPQIPLQEDIDGWLNTLNRWYNSFLPCVGTVHYELLVKAAREDWLRTRAQNDFNLVLQLIGDRMPTQWTRAEIKMHDRAWRDKNRADITFSKTFRELLKLYKDYPPVRAAARPAGQAGKLDPAVELQEIFDEPLTGLALWENTKPIN